MPALKERILKDTALYAGASYLATGIGIVTSLATKAILGAVGAGYWTIFKIFCSYGEYSDLGVRNAMIREIPLKMGAQKTEEAERIQNAVFAFTFSASWVTALILWLAALALVQDPILRGGLFVIALLVVATQHYNFTLTLLRTLKKVKALAAVLVANMLFVAVFSIAGAIWKGAVGMAAGTLAATVVSAVFAYRWGRMRFLWRWDFGEVRRLIAIGFPMVLVSYASVTLISLDAILIGKFLGVREVGYYSIALMCVQQVSALSRYAQIVLLPHAQERYGSTGELSEAVSLFARSARVCAVAIPFAIAGTFFVAPVLVLYFLPKFAPGLPAMRILVLGYFFVLVNEFSVNAAYTADRQRSILLVIAPVIVLAAALNLWVLRMGWGIEGVAAAASASFLIYFLAAYSFAFSRVFPYRRVLGQVAVILAVFLYMGALLAAVDYWIVWPGRPITEACLRVTVFSALFFPFFYRLQKGEGLVSALGSLARKKWQAAAA